MFFNRNTMTDSDIPAEYRCPITYKIMLNPVMTASGHVYEREAILEWFKHHNTNPMSGLPLEHTNLCQYFQIAGEIKTLLAEHPELQKFQYELNDQDLEKYIRRQELSLARRKKAACSGYQCECNPATESKGCTIS